MAISIDKTLPNGVPLSYFRVVSVHIVVNQQCIIELAGYVSQEAREAEQAALAEAVETGQYPQTDIFVHTQYLAVDYDPDMSVNKAYALIKGMEDFEDAEDVIESWAAGESYYIGDMVMYQEQQYECIQSHTSQAGWEPPNAPALWKTHEEGGDGIPVWVQPTGSQDAYMTGDKVHYPTIDDPVYESKMDYNVHSPEAYPEGWQLVEGGE